MATEFVRTADKVDLTSTKLSHVSPISVMVKQSGVDGGYESSV